MLPVDAALSDRLHLGYRTATVATPTRWWRTGVSARAHEFHHAVLTAHDAPPPAWDVEGRAEGFVVGNVHASWLHTHWAATPEVATRFVAAAREQRVRPGGCAVRLTGVGVGPGDPDLITVKAVKVLAGADVVFVPVGDEGATGYAEAVVLAHADPAKVRRLEFALSDDRAATGALVGRRGQRDRGAPARRRRRGVRDDRRPERLLDVHLRRRHRARAAARRRGGHRPGHHRPAGPRGAQRHGPRRGGPDAGAAAAHRGDGERSSARSPQHDTVVAYKGGRRLQEVRALLAAAGRLDDAVFGARLGLDGELIGELPDSGDAPYLSTVIVTRPRAARGARL